ncbi:hypothetical protein [Marine gokushovirus]|nr:hypothetical protein [Marine gokushovirus]
MYLDIKSVMRNIVTSRHKLQVKCGQTLQVVWMYGICPKTSAAASAQCIVYRGKSAN